MSLRNFQNEIAILTKYSNHNMFFSAKDNIMKLGGTESSLEVFEALIKDINKNKQILLAFISILKNPEELENIEELDFYNIPLVKKGGLNSFINYEGNGLNKKLEEIILIDLFKQNPKLAEQIQPFMKSSVIKKIFNNSNETEDEEIEYLKYTELRMYSHILSNEILDYIVEDNVQTKREFGDIKYEEYLNLMAGKIATVYTEKKASTIFNKIDGEVVIEKSNHSHTDLIDEELLALINDNPYISRIEIDEQTDLNKFKALLKELAALKISSPEQFYLKVRLLGKNRATGLYYSGLNVVAIDIDENFSLAHEIAHHIDYTTTIPNREEMLSTFNSFNDYSKLSKLSMNKVEYYKNDMEIIARAAETSYSLFQSDFFNIYQAYLNGEEYNGEIVSNDNIFSLLSNNSSQTYLADSVSNYAKYPHVYFDLKNRTIEQLSNFYFYYQDMYNFQDKIEVNKNEEKNDLLHRAYLDKEIYSKTTYNRRKIKQGFNNYSKEDFESVLSQYDLGHIDLFSKEEFYLKAMISNSHNFKYEIFDLLENDKNVDKEYIFKEYNNFLEEEIKNIQLSFKNIGININDLDIKKFLMVSSNKNISQLYKILEMDEEHIKDGDNIKYIESYKNIVLNNFSFDFKNISSLINISKNIETDDLLFVNLFRKKSFKYTDDLEKFMDDFKNLDKEQLFSLYYSFIIGSFTPSSDLRSYIFKEFTKLINEKELMEEIILKVIEEIKNGNIDKNNRQVMMFLKSNLKDIDKNDYSILNILDIESLTKLDKQNINIILSNYGFIEPIKNINSQDLINLLNKMDNVQTNMEQPSNINEDFSLSYTEQIPTLKIGDNEYSDFKIKYKNQQTYSLNGELIYSTSTNDIYSKARNNYFDNFLQNPSEPYIETDSDLIQRIVGNYTYRNTPGNLYVDFKNDNLVLMENIQEVDVNDKKNLSYQVNSALYEVNDNDEQIMSIIDVKRNKQKLNFFTILDNPFTTLTEITDNPQELNTIISKLVEIDTSNLAMLLTSKDFLIALKQKFTADVINTIFTANIVLEAISSFQNTQDFYFEDQLFNYISIGEDLSVEALLESFDKNVKLITNSFSMIEIQDEDQLDFLTNKKNQLLGFMYKNIYLRISEIVEQEAELLFNNLDSDKKNKANLVLEELDKLEGASNIKKILSINPLKTSKAVNSKEFRNLVLDNLNINISEEYKLGNKNIFHYADNLILELTYRKRKVLTAANSKNISTSFSEISEFEEKKNLIKGLNSYNTRYKQNDEVDYSSNPKYRISFTALEEQIKDMEIKLPKTKKTTTKTKKTTTKTKGQINE